MTHDPGGGDTPNQGISLSNEGGIFAVGLTQLPGLIVRAGDDAVRRFVEFFAATIRNRNTRIAYAQAVGQFCRWCDGHRLELDAITPMAVAAYIEWLTTKRSAPTVKQHLAAIRMLFDWLVTGHVVRVNPAWSVRGPKHVVKKGKTPVLSPPAPNASPDELHVTCVRHRSPLFLHVFRCIVVS